MKRNYLILLAFAALVLSACSENENGFVMDPADPAQASVDRLKPIFSAAPDAEPAQWDDQLTSDLTAVFGPADGEPLDLSSEANADDALILARQ